MFVLHVTVGTPYALVHKMHPYPLERGGPLHPGDAWPAGQPPEALPVLTDPQGCH